MSDLQDQSLGISERNQPQQAYYNQSTQFYNNRINQRIATNQMDRVENIRSQQSQYLRDQNSSDYNERKCNFNEQIMKATIIDREQIINHFKIVIYIEKGYLLHVSLSIILCFIIQIGYFSNPSLGVQLAGSDQLSQIQNELGQILPKDPFSEFIDFYLVSLLQNIFYFLLLSKIIKEDSYLLLVMNTILQQEKQQINNQAINAGGQQQSVEQSLVNDMQQEIQELNQNDENVSSTLSIIDSLIQDNLIVSRRNRHFRSLSNNTSELNCNKPTNIKFNQNDLAQDDLNIVKMKKELYKFESGIINHRVNSKKDHITLYNVLENITETQNFGSKLLVASSAVILYVYNITQINTNILDPQYETTILIFLGIPAIAMILPFCFVLLTLATSVLFLLIYGVSILLLLTYSVISKQIFYTIKLFQLRSTYLKNLSHLTGQTCSICLIEFDEPLEQISKLKCNHSFHYECIKLWMQEKDDCPVCRKKC